jgi:hypothetical protein
MRTIKMFPAAILLVVLSAVINAQSSTFTYQGRLTDSGTSANGTYEMQFKLFDGASNQVGSTVTNSAVTVTDGVFTVTLDYGAAAFSGADRFLEIGVRPAGSANSFTVLAPRQQLTSAVYAIRSGSSAAADSATTATTATNATQLGGVAANQFVQTSDARLTDARTPTAGSANYIQNGNALQDASFNIFGTGSAQSFTGKTINADLGYFYGNTRIIYGPGQFNMFVGQSAGAATNGALGNAFFGHEAGLNDTTGSLNAFFGKSAGRSAVDGNNNAFFGTQAGFKNTAGGSNTFIGEDAGSSNTTGNYNTFVGQNSGVGFVGTDYNTAIGFSSGEVFPGDSGTFVGAFANASVSGLTNATAVGYNSKVSQSNSLVLGSINSGPGTPADTNVGIGTTAPAFRLTVKTATSNYGLVHTDGTVIVGSYVGGSTGGGWFGTKTNHSLSFFVNDGGAAMTIETGGTVKINTLGAAGSTSLCRNASNQISTCSSSLRYKKDLRPFTRGLSLLNQLKPITFKWKADDSNDLGFGAEDIAAVEPLLVTRNDKGEVEGVKYDRITAVLVNAVKEQQEQIKRQQSEIENLKALVCRRNNRARACRGTH